MNIEPDLLTHDQAAVSLGIEVKRLRGYLWRNEVGDPIGDETHVYAWSLEWTRKRLAAARASAVQE